MEKREFRWDLQGLRAVSILLVFVFHLNENIVSAGFFGVDVFFVISGFVITSLLLRELYASNSIDVLNFYSRRAKRLLPNASLVLFVTLVAGMFILPNSEAVNLSRDVIAAAVYLANFHFADNKVDYFSSTQALSAVVHYWSLSIEEQFYIAWPLIMLAVATYFKRPMHRRAIAVILTFIIICSFSLCLLAVRTNQPLAFFHTGTRVWELAAGASLAIYAPQLGNFFARIRESVAAIGFTMILASSFMFSELSVHPGLPTLIPIIGTVLLIGSGIGSDNHGGTYVGKALSSRPMVWIGDRSYSFYLWHWPVILFAKSFLANEVVLVPVTVLLTLVLGEAAFRYVETPLRRHNWVSGVSLLRLSPAVGLVMIICVSAYASSWAAEYFISEKQLFWQGKVRQSMLDDGGVPYRVGCHRGDEEDQPECAFVHKQSKKTVVLFGDSHAAHWFPAVAKAAKIDGWKLNSWSKSSCPSARIRLWNPHKRALYKSCDKWRNMLFERLRGFTRPALVILSNSNGYGGAWVAAPDGNGGISNQAAKEEFERGLTQTVSMLLEMNHKVVIIRDTPLAKPTYRDCVSNYGDASRCERPRSKAINQNKVEKRVASKFATVGVIDVNDQICGPNTCPVVKNGDVIYRDDSHLTIKFSETLYESVLVVLRRTDLAFTDAAAQK